MRPLIQRSVVVSPLPITQLLGQTISAALPPIMAQRHRKHLSACVQSGQPISFEEHFSDQGQGTAWLLTVNPLRNHLDQVDQLLVTALDISKHIQLEAQQQAAEVALVTSAAMFRHLVETANDVIATWGVDGLFTYISPSFQTLLGYRPDDWVGKSFVPLVHPDDLAQCLAINQVAAATGE